MIVVKELTMMVRMRTMEMVEAMLMMMPKMTMMRK